MPLNIPRKGHLFTCVTWEFPSGPVVRTPHFFTAEEAGSIPGWGTQIPQAVWHGQK